MLLTGVLASGTRSVRLLAGAKPRHLDEGIERVAWGFLTVFGWRVELRL